MPTLGNSTDSEIYGDIKVLSDNGFMIRISPRLNGGWIQRDSPPIYYETNSCTGQGYTRGSFRGSIFKGFLFRSQNLEDLFTAYYGLVNEVGTVKQLSFKIYDTGCVELANPLEDTFYPVYLNDPAITGIPNLPYEVLTYEK